MESGELVAHEGWLMSTAPRCKKGASEVDLVRSSGRRRDGLAEYLRTCRIVVIIDRRQVRGPLPWSSLTQRACDSLELSTVHASDACSEAIVRR